MHQDELMQSVLVEHRQSLISVVSCIKDAVLQRMKTHPSKTETARHYITRHACHNLAKVVMTTVETHTMLLSG